MRYAMEELSRPSSCVSVSELLESVGKCKVTACKGVGRSSVPWPESASELYPLSNRRLKLVPTFCGYRDGGWGV
jgi:hypothetical protein